MMMFVHSSPAYKNLLRTWNSQWVHNVPEIRSVHNKYVSLSYFSTCVDMPRYWTSYQNGITIELRHWHSHNSLFLFTNSLIISKAEGQELAGALDSCFVLFGTLQQCAPKEPGRKLIENSDKIPYYLQNNGFLW